MEVLGSGLEELLNSQSQGEYDSGSNQGFLNDSGMHAIWYGGMSNENLAFLFVEENNNDTV
jgi:hypothetical protein